MKNHFGIILAISILIFINLACELPSNSTETDPEVLPEIQTEVETGILFSDDFSDKNSGWSRYSDSGGITDYKKGTYRIYVSEPYWDYWATPGKNFSDVRVEVDATKVGGPDDNDIGVICRFKSANDIYRVDTTNVSYTGEDKTAMQNMDNFYFFIITSDGFYGIGKTVGAGMVNIEQEGLLTSDDIYPGRKTNHIRADCIGSKLSLYVNGILLTTVTDSDFVNGDVGLLAGTYDTTGTDIHFDNFVVYDPAIMK